MRNLGRTLTITLAALLALTGTPAHAGTTDLQPEQLPRGADARIPHVEGNTIVDGALRIPVEGARLKLITVTKAGYIVRTQVERNQPGGQLLQVRPDGTTKVLVRAGASRVVVNSEGTHLAWTSGISDGETVVSVRRIRGTRVLARRLIGYPGGFTEIVDFSGKRLLLARTRSGQTLVWDWGTDSLRTVAATHRWLHAGNLDADVFAAFQAGNERCMVVARISRPGQVLWKNCGERVIAISDDGRRMATTKRSLNPALRTVEQVRIRTIRGRLLGDYTSSSFNDIQWESPRQTLFSVQGDTHVATVRCTPKRCANASDPTLIPVTVWDDRS